MNSVTASTGSEPQQTWSVPYLIAFMVTLMMCFGIQGLAWLRTGGYTQRSESNFFSSLARVQTTERLGADLVLVGSSITGRLPDQTQGFIGIGNMGVDAGSAIDVLRAIDQGLLFRPKLIVVESNTLYRGVRAAPSPVVDAVQTYWYRVGLSLPLLGSSARPAAFLYTRVLASRTGPRQSVAGPSLPLSTLPMLSRLAKPSLDEHSSALAHELAQIMLRLRATGTKVVLVLLPPYKAEQAGAWAIAQWVSQRASIPLWDISGNQEGFVVGLTDDVHMDAASAAATVRTIMRILGP